MANASDYLEGALIAHLTGGSAYTQPTMYVGLATGSTGLETGTPTDEVTAAGYARQSVTWTGSGSSRSNSAAITFTVTAAPSSAVTHWFLADGDTEGADNVLLWGTLSSSVTLAADDSLRIPAGSLTASVD